MWIVYIVSATFSGAILNAIGRQYEGGYKMLVIAILLSIFSSITYCLGYRFSYSFIQCFIIATVCSTTFSTLIGMYNFNEKINVYTVIGLLLCITGCIISQIKNN